MELAAGMVEMPCKDSDIETADSKNLYLIRKFNRLNYELIFSYNTTLLEPNQPVDGDHK